METTGMEMNTDIFFEIHRDNLREGPGDQGSTKRALYTIHDLPEHAKVLDVGCGPGVHTLELAKYIDGVVFALDLHEPYLKQLEQNAINEGLSYKINPVAGDMLQLPFEHESFDLIWSEGAIYIIGFEQGLNYWHDFLSASGYIAVTELSWLRENVPDELLTYWRKYYPEMNGIQKNNDLIRRAGYKLVDHFVLPELAWWENYYKPIRTKLQSLRFKYVNNAEALKIIEEEEQEIDMYLKYSAYYGYVFYIMQKPG